MPERFASIGCNGKSRLVIDFSDGVGHFLSAFILSSVYIDHRHSLCRLNNQIAAGLKPDTEAIQYSFQAV